MTRRCASCRSGVVVNRTGRPRRYCSDACRMVAFRKRRKRSVHFSRKSHEWATPRDLFAKLDAEFHFDLDVAATAENALCARYFTREQDGLAQEWTGVCWMNPPYSQNGRWVRKAHESAQAGATVVCLVPARTDTRWWHEHVLRGEVRFIPGRLRFSEAENSAPFPSAVVVFRNPLSVTKQEAA